MKSMSFISSTLFFVLTSLFLFTSCDNTTIDVSKIVAERDSLIALSSSQQQELENMDSYIFTISSSLDSIARQEDMIIAQRNEGAKISPADLRKSIEDFGNLISRQRSKIALLEDSLNKNKTGSPELQKIITYLKSQLEAKEIHIAQLKSQINSQNRDIKSLKDIVANLGDENRSLEEIVGVQDEMINTGYILIGTKKDLNDAGVLSTKFLSSPKLVVDKLTANMCESVDIRKVTEMSLTSDKPKILTSHPKGSYTIQKMSGGKSSILKILDVSLFWSHSNYLVILL